MVMDFKLSKAIYWINLLNIVFFLSCSAIYAQENPPAAQPAPTDELSLEGELDQALSEPADSSVDKTLPVPGDLEAEPAELTLEAPIAPSDATSEMYVDVDEKQVETLEQEYAMNGYSMGFVVYNQNYNVNASLNKDSTSYDISSKSADIQSAGVVGRYAILPYGKVGTDINASIASSLNSESSGISTITSFKGEVNLGYAFRLIGNSPVYFLAGLGYEIVTGNDIENILVNGGGTAQIGGGLGLGKSLSIEGSYVYSQHSLSQKFIDNAILKSGSATATMGDKAAVTSNTIQGRLVFNY